MIVATHKEVTCMDLGCSLARAIRCFVMKPRKTSSLMVKIVIVSAHRWRMAQTARRLAQPPHTPAC